MQKHKSQVQWHNIANMQATVNKRKIPSANNLKINSSFQLKMTKTTGEMRLRACTLDDRIADP